MTLACFGLVLAEALRLGVGDIQRELSAGWRWVLYPSTSA